MAITEQSRHQMLDALTIAIGEGPAMTLAEHLPPVGWGDVATKQDLNHLEARLDLRFEAIDLRFEAIDNRFEAIDNRFEAIDNRFAMMESRFDLIDERFEKLGFQIDAEIHKALYKSSLGTFAALGVLVSVLSIWG